MSPDYVYQLDVFFPAYLDQCSINFINFVSPSLIAKLNPSATVPVCQQAVLKELQEDGLDSSKLQIKYVP
jgi:hypothetical protein